MQKSARILGQDYGLTAEEMNLAFLKQGFLEGKPGDYRITEKAIEFVKEVDHHKGNGGYSHYNKYWTTRTFDDSIKDYLIITPELKEEIRNELAAVREQRKIERLLAQKEADKAFSKQIALKVNANSNSYETELQYEKLIMKLKKTGKVISIIGGITLLCYGVYKVTPYVKKWWSELESKKKNSLVEEREKSNTNTEADNAEEPANSVQVILRRLMKNDKS